MINTNCVQTILELLSIYLYYCICVPDGWPASREVDQPLVLNNIHGKQLVAQSEEILQLDKPASGPDYDQTTFQYSQYYLQVSGAV